MISIGYSFIKGGVNFAALNDLPDVAKQLTGYRLRFIEEQLRKGIFKLEEREVSDDEVRQNAREVRYTDGKVEWYWHNVCILRQHPTWSGDADGHKFTIKYDVLK